MNSQQDMSYDAKNSPPSGFEKTLPPEEFLNKV